MSEKKIIGRKPEIKILKDIFTSSEAEFLAIYGRRRVGKTHLIREYFSEKGVYFEVTGQKDGTKHDQLENFIMKFSEKFHKSLPLRIPSNWKKAFSLLNDQIEATDKSKKIILFLDELPWLASKRSNLLQVLDYFWNAYWSKKSNFILIACGSAASWMLDNLINAKGGLYNRLTKVISLRPFNLNGVQKFLKSRGIILNFQQILDIYMVFGGIPHYLKQINKGQSASQIINKVCFQKDGLLYGEFNRLFKSLFEHADIHESIVKAIANQRHGISRENLIKFTGISSGGGLNRRLEELEASDLIQSYVPLGRKKKEHYYRICDEYTFFYLKWIESLKKKGIEGGKAYWKNQAKTSKVLSWKGYAFESICLKHVDQICTALDLENIHCNTGSWRFLPKKGEKKTGAQIDLIFDREDGVVTLCEIKYSDKVFLVDKGCVKQLANKIDIFEKYFPTNKQIFFAMITTKGIKHTIWSEDIVHNEIVLSDLFRY